MDFQCEHDRVVRLAFWSVLVAPQAGLMNITLLGGPYTFIQVGMILVHLDAHFQAYFDAGMRNFI